MPTILIVDDDPGLLIAFETVLGLNGYQVRTAATAGAGLQTFEREQPDLVLLDYHLGAAQPDGLEVLRRFRRQRPEVPVMLMSAYLYEATREAALAAGASACLEKPLTLHGLKQCVAQALRHANPVPHAA